MDDYQNHAVAMLERTKECRSLRVKTQVSDAISNIHSASERGQSSTSFYVHDSHTGHWREAMIALGYSILQSSSDWYRIDWSKASLALSEKRKTTRFHDLCHNGFFTPGDIQFAVFAISLLTLSPLAITLSVCAFIAWMYRGDDTLPPE